MYHTISRILSRFLYWSRKGEPMKKRSKGGLVRVRIWLDEDTSKSINKPGYGPTRLDSCLRKGCLPPHYLVTFSM